MKAFLLTFLLLLSATSVIGQKLPDWYRVYTFDESFIEMNTANVILGGDIGRVTFRWVFDQPERLSPSLRYKRRLETIEFKCADKQYRMYEVVFLNSLGKAIRSEMMKPPYAWHVLRSDGVMRTIFGPACQLIEAKLNPPVRSNAKSADELELDRAHEFVLSIRKTLERSRNFQLIVNNFFTPDFIKRYLDDDDSWFFNLDPETASKASYAELKRFYVAQLNAGYLTSLYLISQTTSKADSPDEPVLDEKTIPADIYRLIKRHPYTLTYKARTTGYDYLAENVDSIARMRSYTDLLEKIAGLMREHVIRIHPESSQQYKELWERSDLNSRLCADECLGLPKGTKLFDLTMPPMHLQFAKIKGELKIISARDSSR
jgi:hypothetical protein